MGQGVKTTYRPDIDGLRAIAVAAVVFFHAKVPGFNGGFVGVDVFFVISGYLITTIIANEISRGTFSVLSFYDRRIRRIFPAFFVMILFSAVAGSHLLMPLELKRLGSSIIAATFFSSNILFWHKSGYFAADANSTPLLHSWSLGVEEQFYLAFPLFLWLWLKLIGPRTVWFGVLIIAITSLTLSSYTVGLWQVATFYSIVTRAWELLLGALLAVWPNAVINRTTLRHTASVVGIVLIGWSVFTFSNSTLFPGLNALFPCLGAGLIIVAGKRDYSFVGRLLSNKVFVFTGLISYSLYLWHWPIIVYSNYYLVRPLSGAETAAIVVASFFIATLSWRFIETPFRRSDNWLSSQAFHKGLAAMAVSAAAGAFFYVSNGAPWRLSPSEQLFAAGSQDVGRYMHCLPALNAQEIRERKQLCKLGSSDSPPSFLLWGDSRAAAIADGIDLAAKLDGEAGYFIGTYSCPPVIGLQGWYDKTAEQCKTINESVPELIEQAHLKTVILHAAWAALGNKYGSQRIADAFTLRKDYYRDYYLTERLLTSTLDTLAKLNVKIFVITDTPVFPFSVPEAMARLAHTGRKPDIIKSVLDFRREEEFPSKLLQTVARIYSVHLINPDRAFCGQEICKSQKDGRALFFDQAHLSRFGALSLLPILQPIFPREGAVAQ